MIRFITYVGPWKRASIEGFTFVKGEYLGLPARLAERVLLNPDFQERLPEPEVTEPVVAPSRKRRQAEPPPQVEPEAEEVPETPVPPTLPDFEFDL